MIKIINVDKKYGKKIIFYKFNLSLPPKGMTFLIGKNGSGKSTLFNIICNMETCDKGDILINEIDHQNRKKLPKILFYPSQDVMPQYLTINEYIKFMLLIYNQSYKDNDFMSLIELFSLENEINSQICNLSHGMKKKVQLLMVLLLKFDYCFLDETTNGLDYITKRTVMSKIISKSEGCSIIMATHDSELFDYYDCNNILLEEGKIISNGFKKDILEDKNTSLIKLFSWGNFEKT